MATPLHPGQRTDHTHAPPPTSASAGPPAPATSPPGGLSDSARRIAPLAWPVLVGQLAVLAFSTVDTVLVARSSATDLAALAVGAAAYISVFVGLMGVVLAIGPIAGQAFGAGRPRDAGHQLQQAQWLALGLSVIGCLVLLFPEPFLRLSHTGPEVGAQVRGYTTALAVALPAALLFTCFRGFNTAVSRPKAVMLLQLGGLLLKVPLSALLVFGATLATPWGDWRLPALGATGCGIATAVVMWAQWLAALVLLRRDPFYRRFGLGDRVAGQRWRALFGMAGRPEAASQRGLLRLGVPMGLSLMIEVTGFTFMAFFISRLGATPVAGHQIAANLVALLFMIPLALANATSTLVAQRIGAADLPDARRIGRHGLWIGLLLAALAGSVVFLLRTQIVRLYTHDPLIIAAALPLLAWVAVFHLADAAQALAAFVLRAWHIATLPMLVYVAAIWGVGLGGGYLLAFDPLGLSPAALQGARGFWVAATAGLTVAACALSGLLTWVMRQRA